MRTLRRLAADSYAAVAPTVALSLFALIGAGGIAFDYARLAALDTELQQAADQAALAAATQLDGKSGATNRAVLAAQNLLTNLTVFGNDGQGIRVATGDSTTSGGVTRNRVTFYSTRADAEADINGYGAGTGVDSSAKFVKVEVVGREAIYALTPVVAALSSGELDAAATAGIGSAICKVPPLMICNPRPGTTFDADANRGIGIQVTGHGNDRSGTNPSNTAWAPGDFGFLDVGTGQNSELVKALATQALTLECYSTETGRVTTGNPQGAYDAVNTRFDIYDFSSGNGTTLGSCFSGACPAALNTVKDLFKQNTATNGKGCQITKNGNGQNRGWELLDAPDNFSPIAYDASQTATTRLDTTIAGMGLPRDNCHYTSYNRPCSVTNGSTGTGLTNKIGDGKWAREDYFSTYHSANKPSGYTTWTRYDTYKWELADAANRIPNGTVAVGGNKQYGAPVCSTGTITPGTDRRVLSVAMVENCAALSGSSRTIVIGSWVDMFLVEPTLDTRDNGSLKDSIYMEVIGRTQGTGTGTQTAQTVRRDVPYLIR